MPASFIEIVYRLTVRPSRATCHLQTLNPKLAVADLKRVMALEPGNATVKSQLESTQKLVRKIEFEKVIYTHVVVPTEKDADLRARRSKLVMSKAPSIVV